MQILLPMAGGRAHFNEDEYFFPKPLIEVAGRPMIQRAVERFQRDFSEPKFIYVIDQEDAARFSLDATLGLLSGPDSQVKKLAQRTRGALCTAMMAVDLLDLAKPVLIANYDQVVDENLSNIVDEFTASGAAAGVVTFDSIHPRWSYVRCDQTGSVIEAAEKRVISRQAIAGVYYFDTGRRFIEAAEETILNGDDVDGQFYIAPLLNRLVVKGERIATKDIPESSYHTFFTPMKIETYSDFLSQQAMRDPERGASNVALKVVIPAAGEGSRFQNAGWGKPKPFIDIGGRPMISRVIENVTPQGAVATVLLRQQSIDQYSEIVGGLRADGSEVQPVDILTEGTACTVLLARDSYQDAPMMVANSDQLVDFDCGEFVKDCVDRGLDGSILVFRDAEQNPKWSFARTGKDGLVVEVAEKKAISSLATVGIYLFMNGQDFVNAAADMIARNDRVNGEFYTCPVYNYMIANGKKIGVYEVPPGAMHGLGTPDDLSAYLADCGMNPSADRPGAEKK
ncbi:glycosyltransferase family 2 protein [Maricaulis sp.]|uniref:glycosyltransferase family 2 protein n=1 Tax=Maricaulis sp. TaxID=1486257 RepID=UPI003A929AF0